MYGHKSHVGFDINEFGRRGGILVHPSAELFSATAPIQIGFGFKTAVRPSDHHPTPGLW